MSTFFKSISDCDHDTVFSFMTEHEKLTSEMTVIGT